MAGVTPRTDGDSLPNKKHKSALSWASATVLPYSGSGVLVKCEFSFYSLRNCPEVLVGVEGRVSSGLGGVGAGVRVSPVRLLPGFNPGHPL